MSRVIDVLSKRPTIFLKKPFIASFVETKTFQEVVYIPGVKGPVNSEISQMIESKKKEWTDRGISPTLQNMAIELAISWAERMSGYHSRVIKETGISLSDENKVRLYKVLLKEGLDTVAEHWIKRMTE